MRDNFKKIIFGTTNKRKIEDLINLINYLNLNLEVLSLKDIGFQEEIFETGTSLEENSLIKAKTIYEFCHYKNIDYPIITDDAGLFVESLNGEPGVYTGRYADDELKNSPSLPKYYGVIKLLNKLENIDDRSAKYKCVVTCMMKDGTYFQEKGESTGIIAKEIIGELKKPYFYSVFILNKLNKVFSSLEENELRETYRYKALTKTLTKI